MSGNYYYGICCHKCDAVIKKRGIDLTNEAPDGIPYVDLSSFCQETFECDECESEHYTGDQYMFIDSNLSEDEEEDEEE